MKTLRNHLPWQAGMLTLVLATAAVLLTLRPAAAQMYNYHVTLDASPLSTSDAGPFTLEFQLTSGIAPDGNRTQAVLENFTFGGGSATGAPAFIGGAAGALTTGVTLGTSSFLNDFQQSFLPQGTLAFDLSLTTDPANPPRDPADGFSFAILDNTGTEIPTLGFFDIGSDVLLSMDLDGSGAPHILTYATDDSVPPAGGTTPITMDAPVVTIPTNTVPEPGTWAFLGGIVAPGLLLLHRRARR